MPVPQRVKIIVAWASCPPVNGLLTINAAILTEKEVVSGQSFVATDH
jgi:hypothetical protein